MTWNVAFGLIVAAVVYTLTGIATLGMARSWATVGLTWLYGGITLGESLFAIIDVLKGHWLTAFYTAVMGILYSVSALTLYRLPRHRIERP